MEFLGGAIHVPEEWARAGARIARSPGMAMLLGASDTGKTTLAGHLIEAWLRAGHRVALVDGDIGQSSLGLPTTVSMAHYLPSGQTSGHPMALRFVGSTSPAGRFLQLAVALKILADRALAQGADIVLVDTTGLVSGPPGRTLKFQKIALIGPAHLLALQRGDELEPLLLPHQGRATIHRLPVPAAVCPKSREGRRAFRERKFRDYLREARPIRVSWKEARVQDFWLGTGRRLPQADLAFVARELGAVVLYGERGSDEVNLIASGGFDPDGLNRLRPRLGTRDLRVTDLEDLRGLVVGLNDSAHETLAVGLIQDLDPRAEALTILSPLRGPDGVAVVQFGNLRLDPTGRELGDFGAHPARRSPGRA